MTGKRWAAVTAAVAILVGAVTAAAIVAPWEDDAPGDAARRGVDETDPAVEAADAFAAAWAGGHLDQVGFTSDSGDPALSTTFITAGLTAADLDLPKVEVTGVTHPDGERAAVAAATVTWTLDGGRVWTYTTKIPLRLEAPGPGTASTTTVPGTADGASERWLVAWTPAVVEPSLVTGELLRADRIAANRGDIVDRAGVSLVAARGSVVVGIKPSRSTDPAATARAVAGLTGVDTEQLVARVTAAAPDDVVEVVTLDRAAYDAIRAQIQPLPGTVFTELDDVGAAVPAGYARAVVGTVGPATAEEATASEGRVVVGDLTGLSGLQSSQDAVLAGTPGTAVRAVHPDGSASDRTVKEYPAVAGTSITVTLDQRTQLAAEAAVATTEKPSALVAIQVSTGDVLAVANGPAGSTGFNRAMVGRYPPGSTFKVVSALAYLEKGLTPDTVVDCPATIVVGKEFSNAEGEVLGSVPFRSDFAHSCNTAFVGQSTTISDEELTATAARLGYRELDLGLPLFDGSVPPTDSTTEHAANVIGQGKVEGSVFTVALASASVANGSSLQPRLIVDPAHPEPVAGEGLPPAQIAQLRDMMRAVVTSGTGRALLGLPGGEVFGKTGTAEYGSESPPRTHAWFTGFQGDIAFAVLVDDGGFGAEVAAPVAARFLTDLASP